MAVPVEHKRRFIRAVRSGQFMFAEIAREAGLTLQQVFDVWSEGSAAGRLRIGGGDLPGMRFVEEVPA